MGKRIPDVDQLLYSVWVELGKLEERMRVMRGVVHGMKRTVERVAAMMKEVQNEP